MSKCNEGIKYRLRAVHNNLQLSIKQRASTEIIFSPHFLPQRALSAFWGVFFHCFFFSNQFELKLSDINTYSYCTEYVLYNGLKKIIQRNISFKLLIIFFYITFKGEGHRYSGLGHTSGAKATGGKSVCAYIAAYYIRLAW